MRTVVRSLLGSRRLLRVVAAYAMFILVEYSVWLAMLVYAYGHGGATAAGLIAFVQLVPSAIVAPFASVVADRSSPVRLFLAGCGLQAIGMALAAVAILADGPPVLAYAGAIVAATAVSTIRPAQAALLPTLARTADELTAANVALAAAEAFAVAGAGLLTAGLLSRGPGEVFAAGVVLICASAWAVAPLPAVAMGVTGATADGDGEAEEEVSVSPLADVRDGVRVLSGVRGARVLVGLLGAQDVVLGGLDVLFVVLAITVLQADQSWVGYLNSAFGVGGVLVGAVGVLLIGRRLPVPILASAVVVGASLSLASVANNAVGVVVLLVIMGAARSIFDLASRTLLQRSVPADLVGRVFGLVEGLSMAGLAVGSLAVSALVAIGGANAALIGIGAVLPIVVAISARTLLALDRDTRVPIVEIGLLRSIDLFAQLPPPAVESLARALEPRRLVAGEVLIKQGDPGDHYYAVADGTVEVSRDGKALRTCARGSGVGEIALLRSVPRTATVIAQTDALVYVLDRASFLVAMTGHASTATAAGRRVDRILSSEATPV